MVEVVHPAVTFFSKNYTTVLEEYRLLYLRIDLSK